MKSRRKGVLVDLRSLLTFSLCALILLVFVSSAPVVHADERSDALTMGLRGVIVIVTGVIVLGLALNGRGPLAKLFDDKSTV